jgi:nucleoside-diphosphate-sugar epimerase
MNPHRVLLTGGSGFIGRQVLARLQDQGHEVLAVSRHPPASDGAVRWHAGDPFVVESLAGVVRAFAPTACIHLAWYAEPGKYLHADDNLDALAGSLALLRLLAEVGCRQVVGAGTCAEYARSATALASDAPTAPDTVYAAAKLALASVGARFAQRHGLRFAWGRIFHLYGPEEDARRLVPSAIRTLLAGRPFPASAGTQVRDYLHVADVAAAFVRLLEADADGVFNICSGQPVTVAEILTRIGDETGRRALLRLGECPANDWDPPVVLGDATALHVLGWAPQVALVDGLREAVRWWRERPDAAGP